MASFLNAPRTGNAVADPNDIKRVETTGHDRDAPGKVSVRSTFFAMLNPPQELAKVQFLPLPQAALVPAIEGAPGVASQQVYLSNQGAPRRDVSTLFHAMPPSAQQFPRAMDSENNLAAPPRVRMPALFKVFSKPRRGTPGSNPMGINNTASG